MRYCHSTDANCRFSSFIESHGKPLLDLSLFVSSQNYTTTTRPIYNTIQPFPLPYLTPPALREAAKEGTEHLGLSSLDVDSQGNENTTPEKSIIPESLQIPRPSITGLLSANPENAAQIRLDALATDFFEPLEKLKGNKRFFVSDEQFSSLDCLALGHLSLMLIPDLPQPWLKKIMQKKFPSLCAFVEDLRPIVYGDVVTVEDTLLKSQDSSEQEAEEATEKSVLPWKASENRSAVSVGNAFLSGLLDVLPVIGQLRKNSRVRHAFGKPVEADGSITVLQRVTKIGAVVTGLGFFVGFMLHQGLIKSPFGLGYSRDDEKQNASLGDMGEAGAALAAFATQMDLEVQRQKAQEGMIAPGVEIDVETQPNRVVRDKVI